MIGCINFVFSGKSGIGKNYLVVVIGNCLLKDGQIVIVVIVVDVMSVLYVSYDDGQLGEKFLWELCEVDLLVFDEIGIQCEMKNEQVVLYQIVDCWIVLMCSVGMLINLNYEVMKILFGEWIMDCMIMNGG